MDFDDVPAFSNHSRKYKLFLPCFYSLLLTFCPFGHFFCSTAPQAFFRPNHVTKRLARAGAVKIGRRSDRATNSGASRPHLDGTEHDGMLFGLGRNAPPSAWVLPSAIADLCRLHRSLRGRGTLAASWTFESFGAAMSRTGSPKCRGKNRAVAEARPGRDDVSPGWRKGIFD